MQIIEKTIYRGINDTYQKKSDVERGGKMGDSLLATSEAKKQTVFIKIPAIPSSSGHFFKFREALSQRFNNLFMEYMNYKRLGDINAPSKDHVAAVLDAGLFEHTFADTHPIVLPFIVQEYVDGQNLKEYVADNFPYGMPVDVWESFSSRIAHALALVHNESVYHGDFHPGNIMREEASGDLKIVDFGQAFFADVSFAAPDNELRRKHNFYNDSRRRGAQVDYGRQADIYSLGATMLYLATGWNLAPKEDSPEGDVLFRLLTPTSQAFELTKGVETVLARNPKLVQDFPGVAAIIVKAMHHDSSLRYQHIEELIEDLELLSPTPKEAVTNLTDVRNELVESSEGIDGIKNPFFRHVAFRESKRYARRANLLKKRHARIDYFGHRDVWFTELLRLLSLLDKGDQYFTVTRPLLWNENNLGWNQRFMALNKTLIMRGVAVSRLFVLDDYVFDLTDNDSVGEPADSLGNSEEAKLHLNLWQQVYRKHLQVYREISERENALEMIHCANFFRAKKSMLEENGFLDTDNIVALWVKDGSYTAVNFQLDDTLSQIVGISFTDYTHHQGEELIATWKDAMQMSVQFPVMDAQQSSKGLVESLAAVKIANPEVITVPAF